MRRRALAGPLGLVVAATLSITAGQGLAQASSPTGADAAPSPSRTTAGVSFEHSCGTPRPGEATCFALRRTDTAPARGLRSALAAPQGFGASDLRSAYALPDNGGAGQTIAIVDAFDDPTAEADLAVYRQQYGLPACTADSGCFTKVDQRGGTAFPAPDEHWAGEISIDLDMASATAPLAHILLVEADSAELDDLGAAVDEAVALGAKFVSNSYGSLYSSSPGSGEDPSDIASNAHYDHPGVAVVASSGDSGYGVTYPAASPFVTAVGGTSLTRDSSARGWSESVWGTNGGAGSGCSLYEPKPAFQLDTGCAHRTVADVSAVGDPSTGVAVYQDFGAGGWQVYGGTSVAAPIIAGVYASAGTPDAGTYPNAFPYNASGTGLNDVTSGSNGTCDTTYLCSATAGYDGPTGLGTPNGTLAFRGGPHGKLSGTVTDAATGKPLAGASVTAQGTATTHTDAQGRYTLSLPVGQYSLTEASYGYADGAAATVSIGDGASVVRDFTLKPVPSEKVSGKVTDGSGHGWPLYADISVDGAPGAPVWTDPATGAYSVKLPRGHAYTLHVNAAYRGYLPLTRTVHVGSAGQNLDLPMQADPWAATAAGYRLHLTGTTEGFDQAATPKNWHVVNAPGTEGGWTFDDPGERGNSTGGQGGFAVADSYYYGENASQDSQLVSPDYDFTRDGTPELAFDSDYEGYEPQRGEVDVSTDQGRTWSTVWAPAADQQGTNHVEVPLTDYAGRPSVRVRFHFVSAYGWDWEVDNVFVGERDFDPTPGGLVVGTVEDANTRAGLVGAVVAPRNAASGSVLSVATPADPAVGDGFFALFSTATGSQRVTATKWHYTAGSETVDVRPGRAVSKRLKLTAGRLSIGPAAIDASVGSGGRVTRTVTVKNTGSAPATITLAEQPGALHPASVTPLLREQRDISWLASTPHESSELAAPQAVGGTADDAWSAGPDLPVPISDNAVASFGGKVYSAFGFDGRADSRALHVLDPATGTWTERADAADTRQDPAHGFINGKFYAVGGWGADGSPDPKLEIYDPATDTWTTGAPQPRSYAASGSAVLDGKLYTIGGCGTGGCGTTDVSVYDAAHDTWSQAAPYPGPVSWSSCAGISGKVYCAGGVFGRSPGAATYIYDPAANTWTRTTNPPIDIAGAASTTANGQLLLSGGGSDRNIITNQSFAFDPRTSVWTVLPNAATPRFRGGGAPGFYTVGGTLGSTGGPSAGVELLHGFDQEEAGDVSWLSTSKQQMTLRPGESRTIKVTLDAGRPAVLQPGGYGAELATGSDTPYYVPYVAVALHVTAGR